jgi:predicted phosphodiesterase
MFKRLLGIAVVGLTLFGLFSCVSQTTVDQRFSDSAGLTPPSPASVALTDPNNFTFAVVGDLHISHQDTARLGRMLTAASAEGDSFFIFLGDLVDAGLEDDVVAFRSALSGAGWDTQSFPVIGNHDIFAGGWTYYKKYNGPSNYSFTVGNSKFIVLDTADGTIGYNQRQWFSNELQKSRPANLFVASHYLPTIPGERTYLKISDDVEALDMMKLAKSNGVNAWLGGHYHSYLLGGVNGVSYLVAGGGGAARMPPVSEFFFVQVKVSGSQISYQMNAVP